ncbi:hypothetical protein Tco_0979455 [Tanacetum coccineum]
MSSGLLFYTSSDDKDEVNSDLAFFTKACSVVIQASKPKISRNQVDIDRYGAHDRLVDLLLRTLTVLIVWEKLAFPIDEVYTHGMTKQHSVLIVWEKLAFPIDEYLQMGATTAHESLVAFWTAIIELYGNEFLRKPTYTDIE